MPEEKKKASIDYDAAAEQLIAVLAERAKGDNRDPVSASLLFVLVFGSGAYAEWQHETRRRRIREIAEHARKALAAAKAPAQICASGEGYWLSSDAATIAAYAAKRRAEGLAHMAAAAHQVKPTIAPAAGQLPLTPESTPTDPLLAPIPKPQYRH